MLSKKSVHQQFQSCKTLSSLSLRHQCNNHKLSTRTTPRPPQRLWIDLDPRTDRQIYNFGVSFENPCRGFQKLQMETFNVLFLEQGKNIPVPQWSTSFPEVGPHTYCVRVLGNAQPRNALLCLLVKGTNVFVKELAPPATLYEGYSAGQVQTARFGERIKLGDNIVAKVSKRLLEQKGLWNETAKRGRLSLLQD